MTKLTIIFITLSIICKGQLLTNDTINFSNLSVNKTYFLEKVTQKNGSPFYGEVDKNMFLWIVTAASINSDSKTSSLNTCDLNLKTNDTLIYMDWDIESKKGMSTLCRHCNGKINIDQKSNILQIKKCRFEFKTRTPIYMERKFKILKLTKTTFIIKDISLLDLTYKFKIK